MYRQEGETPRCEFCGGGDIHTFTCFGVYLVQRDAQSQAAKARIRTYHSEVLGRRVTVPED